jgi:hypothetical protein
VGSLSQDVTLFLYLQSLQLETSQPRSRRTRIFDRNSERDEEKSSEFGMRGDGASETAAKSLSDRTSSMVSSSRDEAEKDSIFLQKLRNKARMASTVESESNT